MELCILNKGSTFNL